MEQFKHTSQRWNLLALLERWQQSDGEETWPWVWTWRNENGPHFIFIGINERTLQLCIDAAEQSPQHNLTLVVSDLQEIYRQGHKPEDFYAQRCAIVESLPSQIDFKNQILMLNDERILCFDELHMFS